MNDLANLWARLRALTQIINELKARIAALEARMAAQDQQTNQRWFQ